MADIAAPSAAPAAPSSPSSAQNAATSSAQSQQQQSSAAPTASSSAATAPNGTDASNQKQPAPAATAEKKAEIARKLKLKVDKQDLEVSEDDAIKLAQLGLSSNKRYQEAAQMRKQAEDFISLLKTDPKAVLSNPAIGINLRQFAEEYLATELKRETLSPEQRKIAEYEEKLKAIDDEKKAEASKKDLEQQEAFKKQYADEYEKQFTEVLGTAGLPKTAMTIKRMANYMELALNNGMEDIKPHDVVELVRQDYVREVSELFGQTDGDKLLAILGDSVANKIRKADLARLKAPIKPSEPVAEVSESGSDKTDPTSRKPMNIHEWRAMMEKKKQS